MRKKRYSKNIGVMLNEPLYRMLVQITDDKEITVSEFVRQLIENKLNQGGGKDHDSKILPTL